MFSEKIVAPQLGWKTGQEYYLKCSNTHRLPMVQVPTFFLNSEDDPICHESVIDKDLLKANPFVALGITRYGGHAGYHESFFSFRGWMPKVAVAYFKALEKLG